MITATIAGDTIKTFAGTPYTWASIELAVKELVTAYPDSLDAIEIECNGKVVAYLF